MTNTTTPHTQEDAIMRFPGIAKVRAALTAEHLYIRRTFHPAELIEHGQDLGDAGVDVRLQVWPDGSWNLHTGDSSYDQDHRGYWGAAFLPFGNCNLTEIARDLIEQAKDHRAQEVE